MWARELVFEKSFVVVLKAVWPDRLGGGRDRRIGDGILAAAFGCFGESTRNRGARLLAASVSSSVPVRPYRPSKPRKSAWRAGRSRNGEIHFLPSSLQLGKIVNKGKASAYEEGSCPFSR